MSGAERVKVYLSGAVNGIPECVSVERDQSLSGLESEYCALQLLLHSHAPVGNQHAA